MRMHLLFLILFLCLFLNCKKYNDSKTSDDNQNTKIDKSLLIGIWDSEPGGDADFQITSDEFYLVDFLERYDYKIEKNSILINGSDFFKTGRIINISKDSLKIKWIEQDLIVEYGKFKN